MVMNKTCNVPYPGYISADMAREKEATEREAMWEETPDLLSMALAGKCRISRKMVGELRNMPAFCACQEAISRGLLKDHPRPPGSSDPPIHRMQPLHSSEL